MKKGESSVKALFDTSVEFGETGKLQEITQKRGAWKMQPEVVITIPLPERKNWAMSEGIPDLSMRQLEHQSWLADRMNYAELLLSVSIEVHADIRSGVPVIRGTRVALSQVLAEIAEGASITEIADDLEIDENPIREFFQSFSIWVDRPFT